MKRLEFSPSALADLREIRVHLLTESPDAAAIVGDGFRSAFRRLREFPALGHVRQDLAREDFRFFAVYRYLIVYQSTEQAIRVARIVHASRDVPSMLEG